MKEVKVGDRFKIKNTKDTGLWAGQKGYVYLISQNQQEYPYQMALEDGCLLFFRRRELISLVKKKSETTIECQDKRIWTCKACSNPQTTGDEQAVFKTGVEFGFKQGRKGMVPKVEVERLKELNRKLANHNDDLSTNCFKHVALIAQIKELETVLNQFLGCYEGSNEVWWLKSVATQTRDALAKIKKLGKTNEV